MTTAAEMVGNPGYVNGFGNRTSHHLHMITHLNEDKKSLGLIQITQPVGQGTDFLDVMVYAG